MNIGIDISLFGGLSVGKDGSPANDVCTLNACDSPLSLKIPTSKDTNV